MTAQEPPEWHEDASRPGVMGARYRGERLEIRRTRDGMVQGFIGGSMRDQGERRDQMSFYLTRLVDAERDGGFDYTPDPRFQEPDDV